MSLWNPIVVRAKIPIFEKSQSKTLTIAQKEGATLNYYWEDGLTIDIADLVDVTEGAVCSYTLETDNGEMEGSVLTCPLVGTYTVCVTAAETDTQTAASYTFTITVETNPNTGSFEGDWVTL